MGKIICIIVAMFTMVSRNQEESKYVKLQSSDSTWFYVYDRNAGVNVPTLTQVPIALNYTNDKNHADHKKVLFQGDYYTWEEAKIACSRGWRLPTKAELEVINSKMKFSNGTAYLEDGDGNKCYSPLSGRSSSHSYVRGDYWSCTEVTSSSVWYLSVSSSSSNVCGSHKSNGLVVRCVKTVTGCITRD